MLKINNNSVIGIPTLSQEICKKILRDIIDGHYLPLSKLPTERALAQKFHVARQVVRESLKHLEALGVITIRQRSGIIVNDLPISCFFEHFELFLFDSDGTLDVSYLRDLLKFRRDIFIQVVRDAAKNRTRSEINELKKISREFAEARDDSDQLLDIMIRFTITFAKASHNRIYQMLANTGIRVLYKVFTILNPAGLFATESKTSMDQIIEAVENRDDEIAVLLVTRNLKEFDSQLLPNMEDDYNKSVQDNKQYVAF